MKLLGFISGRELRSSGLNLRMGPVGCPETSVRNYHHCLRNSPEERGS